MPPSDLVQLPKVVLHDHLDGGLRPSTILEVALQTGYAALPAWDVESLSAWFYQGEARSLERYLESFTHTVGVMQTAPAIERVAYEAVEDLASDGVVYAEIRMAPSLCTERGLPRQEVIEAVLRGLARGEADFGMPARMIVDAMRQETDSAEVARIAVEYAGAGVVGFDLAGPERGFPATAHREACELATSGGLRLTLHAGEGDGTPSIASALAVGCERIGHGVRVVEDVEFDGDEVRLGDVARQVVQREVTLEVCPTSNLHTGLYPSPTDHPVGALARAGFAVTLNTDNRLMSATSPSQEFALVVDHHGMTRSDLKTMTLRALDAAFCDDATRESVRRRVIDGYT